MKLQAGDLFLLGVFVFSCVLAGCGEAGDGLVKHQVTGRVLLNGTPEKGIAVCFHHTDPDVTKNAARPVAVTDEDGSFALSTNGPTDGAIEGDYIVTFFWPEGGTSTRDFLKGKYTSKESSNFKVTIGGEDTDLKDFELEAPANDVQDAKKTLASRGPQN